MSGAQPLRDDDVERTAERFDLGKTEDSRRPAIPEAYCSVCVRKDDCVGHSGKETFGEMLQVRLHGLLHSEPVPMLCYKVGSSARGSRPNARTDAAGSARLTPSACSGLATPRGSYSPMNGQQKPGSE